MLSLITAGSAAQGEPQATPGGPSDGYPVGIHEGTCANPTAEPAWQTDDAVAIGVDDDEPEVIGTDITRTVAETTATLDVTLDDLAGSEHVVAIHASPDQFGTIVACGQIAGIKEDGKLVVALAEVGDSAVTGVAILDEDESGFLGLGDEQTQMTVYIIVPNEEDAATPAA